MSTHLTIDGLTKRFGSIMAVDDVSLELEKGEFASIVGPSGSGKTTILRMIAGFEDPTAGSITIDGSEITGSPPFERDVNMVFQNLALFPHLTVGENIKYGMKYDERSFTKAEMAEQVESILEMVDLVGYADRDISELSGGEKQRVALGRAVVKEPEILLFDEPLASLDRKLRQDMKIELQRIQNETGITFLYVTHDQEVALSVSDKMIVLNEGEIAQKGSPRNLYDHPNSAFVADFVGDANIITARITEIAEETLSLRVEGQTGTIPVDDRISRELIADHSIETDIEVALRPHDLELSRTEVDEQMNFSGTVEGKTYTGEKYIYHVSLDNHTVNVSDDGGEFEIGSQVFVSCQPATIHVFEPRKRQKVHT